MRLTVCDTCEDRVNGEQNNLVYVSSAPVLCDKSAKITVNLRFGFQGHSTGFCGPPDLCEGCAAKIAETALDAWFPNRRPQNIRLTLTNLEFERLCIRSELTNENGHGYYADEGVETDIMAVPSDVARVGANHSHPFVVWYFN